MNAQIRLANWQWVFVVGLAIALVITLITLVVPLAWLGQLGMILFGLLWLASGLMVVSNWRGGLDAAIQQEHEILRRRGKEPDAIYWDRRRKGLRVMGFIMIAFGPLAIAFGVWLLMRFPV